MNGSQVVDLHALDACVLAPGSEPRRGLRSQRCGEKSRYQHCWMCVLNHLAFALEVVLAAKLVSAFACLFTSARAIPPVFRRVSAGWGTNESSLLRHKSLL